MWIGNRVKTASLYFFQLYLHTNSMAEQEAIDGMYTHHVKAPLM